MEFAFEIMYSVLNPITILIITLGVVMGVCFGVIPGLSGPVGVALLLSLTYSLTPINGLLMLSGIYMGATYGGSISAILLNIPGTNESVCTGLEGYPMAKKGRAKEALYLAALSSFIGGICGVIALILFAPMLANVALKFGPPELFLVTTAGLAVVGSLLGSSLFKGFFALSFGLFLSIVGFDSMNGEYRLLFGIGEFKAGFALVPVSVGLFAIAQMLSLKGTGNRTIVDVPMQDVGYMEVITMLFKRKFLLIKSIIIGTIIGVLPGAGGSIASFISYGEAKRSAKVNKNLFGKGNPDGIIAPESANNAAVGGSFVPLFSLGIPGSTTSAIIFGAITIHGLTPGPKLFVDNAEIAYGFMYGMILTVIIMLIIGTYGVKFFSKILLIDTKFIIPPVLVFALLGAYSARNSINDVLLVIVIGSIGLFFIKAKIPTPPVLLGLILGTMTEENLRRSLISASAKGINIFEYIFLRPISLIILILLFLILYANFKTMIPSQKEKKKAS